MSTTPSLSNLPHPLSWSRAAICRRQSLHDSRSRLIHLPKLQQRAAIKSKPSEQTSDVDVSWCNMKLLTQTKCKNETPMPVCNMSQKHNNVCDQRSGTNVYKNVSKRWHFLIANKLRLSQLGSKQKKTCLPPRDQNLTSLAKLPDQCCCGFKKSGSASKHGFEVPGSAFTHLVGAARWVAQGLPKVLGCLAVVTAVKMQSSLQGS